MRFYLTKFADVYNCATYGSGQYGSCVEGAATSTDPLANTGYDVLIPVILGISLITAGLILVARRLWRKYAASR